MELVRPPPVMIKVPPPPCRIDPEPRLDPAKLTSVRGQGGDVVLSLVAWKVVLQHELDWQAWAVRARLCEVAETPTGNPR